MADENALTVETSLDALIDAVGKAADDYRSACDLLVRIRADLAAANTSVSRSVTRDATRVLDHLGSADEALRDVVQALEERD